MLEEFNKRIKPLAQSLPFYERISATTACEVCDWTEDLVEIEYTEVDDSDQSFYLPSPVTKVVRCSSHADRLMKRLAKEGIEVTIHGIENADPYNLYYEVEDDKGMADEMLDHDYYDENGEAL